MKLRRSRRPGFTLLELLLASMIASMLLYALYFMMNITLRQTSDARDAIEIDAVSRGTFNRMSLDLSAVLAPLPPKSGGNFTSTDTAAQMPTTSTDPSAAAAPTDSSMATEETPPPQNNPLQAGLIGESDWFIIYVSCVPEPLTSPTAMMRATDPSSGVPLHDLRMIVYWKGENGGLCRQVRPLVTADGILNATGPDRSNEAADTIVEEVKELTFEYLFMNTDGSPSWQGSWNGSTLGADSATPQGPPRAVRVTLKFQFPASPNNPVIEKTVVHVIPVRTGPGPITPTPIDPATDTGDASTGMGTTPTTGTGNTGTGNTGTGNTGTGNTGSTQPSTGGAGTQPSSSGGATQPSTGGGGGTQPTTGGGGGGTKTGGGGR